MIFEFEALKPQALSTPGLILSTCTAVLCSLSRLLSSTAPALGPSPMRRGDGDLSSRRLSYEYARPSSGALLLVSPSSSSCGEGKWKTK